MHPGPGEFVGNPSTLSGRAAVVQAVVDEDGEILPNSADQLRKSVIEDSELSDLILSTFLARRTALIAGEHRSLTLIGSRCLLLAPDGLKIGFVPQFSSLKNWLRFAERSRLDQAPNTLSPATSPTQRSLWPCFVQLSAQKTRELASFRYILAQKLASFRSDVFKKWLRLQAAMPRLAGTIKLPRNTGRITPLDIIGG